MTQTEHREIIYKALKWTVNGKCLPYGRLFNRCNSQLVSRSKFQRSEKSTFQNKGALITCLEPPQRHSRISGQDESCGPGSTKKADLRRGNCFLVAGPVVENTFRLLFPAVVVFRFPKVIFYVPKIMNCYNWALHPLRS